MGYKSAGKSMGYVGRADSGSSRGSGSFSSSGMPSRGVYASRPSSSYSSNKIDTRGYMGASRAVYEALRPHHKDPSRGYTKKDYMDFSNRSYRKLAEKVLKAYESALEKNYLAEKRTDNEKKDDDKPCIVCGDAAMPGSPFCLVHFLNQTQY